MFFSFDFGQNINTKVPLSSEKIFWLPPFLKEILKRDTELEYDWNLPEIININVRTLLKKNVLWHT